MIVGGIEMLALMLIKSLVVQLLSRQAASQVGGGTG